MASLAFRQMSASRRIATAVMPIAPRRPDVGLRVCAQHRQVITVPGQKSPPDDFAALRSPDVSKPKKPRRRWMSVQDLVTEVEKAMLKGVQLDKDGPTYTNLDSEMQRLRSDNDVLMDTKENMKVTRLNAVLEEAQVTKEMKEEYTSEVDAHPDTYEDLIDRAVLSTKKIQELDWELAVINAQKKQNIMDVGALKLVKSRIETAGDVRALVERVEESLKNDEFLAENGPEAVALNEMIARCQTEYDAVTPKILSYGQNRLQLTEELQRLNEEVIEKKSEIDGSYKPGHAQEVDKLHQQITAKLRQDTRMVAQMGRLRHIQIMNNDYIAMLERARAKLLRYAIIHGLLEKGDAEQIQEKVKVLDADLDKLRISINNIESQLEAHGIEGKEMMKTARSLKNTFTPEAGKQRELLIANIHQEEQWKSRLAVLRGEQMQKLRFLGLLMAALNK